MISKIYWSSGEPPLAEPLCGFRGEKCICEFRTNKLSSIPIVKIRLKNTDYYGPVHA